jgi:hypothetical protein
VTFCDSSYIVKLNLSIWVKQDVFKMRLFSGIRLHNVMLNYGENYQQFYLFIYSLCSLK